jgi:hypothetical protein
MGLRRISRAKHAGAQMLAAAAIGAMPLCAAGPAAAAPGTRQTAWTKTWAERELQLHFDATTVVCLPLGRAVVVDGSRQYTQFVCGVVLVDGTRYSIRLHPISRTTWTIEGMNRLGGSPAPPGSRRPPPNQPAKKTPTNPHTATGATTTTETATDKTTDTTTQPAAPGGAHSGGKGNAKS